MTNRRERVRIAEETVAILHARAYTAPSGRRVTLEALEDSIAGTVTYSASVPPPAVMPPAGCRTEVVSESTLAAARRLVQREGRADVAVLNFASAKNPGGGFLGGAQAQEESLARASGLYACLEGQSAYYGANRHCGTCLYTDAVIWSPDVPFFRGEDDSLLEEPFLASVITAPAPNAGAVRRNEPERATQIEDLLRSRCRKVLAVAALHERRALVLGAWGCGVFENDPRCVAQAFAGALRGPELAGAFDRVVFAIHERDADHPNLRAFQDVFA